MGNNIDYTLCSLFFSLLLTIVFFSKKRLKSLENKIYSILIVTNLIGLIIHVFSGILTPMTSTSISSILFSKLYCVYLLTWIVLFTIYVFVISKKNTGKMLSDYYHSVFKATSVIYIVSLFTMLILPLKIYNSDGIIYTYGLSIDFLYIISALCIVIIIICLLTNLKNVSEKKYIPIFLFLIIGVAVMYIQLKRPELLLMTAMETYITFMMYFTIENPDMKVIEQLNMAKETAEKANHAKTDFLSSMSHEIRTPLNAIVGFSECIESSKTLSEAKENANDIVDASKTLLEIVNGILDISKIEAGKLEIIDSSYNPKECFLELAKLMELKMKSKGLDFQVNIAPDLPNSLYGDEANIKKIITNLLSNAYKYTEKGYVKYSVQSVTKGDVCRLIINVEDSGRGIKKENIDKLFTKFQRLDEDRNTTIEGTGLGLAITKQLVTLMGGRIVVSSTYQVGSKFSVSIDQKIDNGNTPSKEAVQVSDKLDLTNKNILVVDDNLLNLKVGEKLLEKYNGKAVCVDSGFKCLEEVKTKKYDLILLDDMMPKMSGVETLKKLKEDATFNTPVIALTANALNGMRDKYLREGFNDYIPKPIEKDEFVRVINKVLNGKDISMFSPLAKEIYEVGSMDKDSSDVIIPVESIETNEVIEDAITTSDSTNDVQEEVVPKDNNIIYDEDYLKRNGIDMDKSLEYLGDMSMYNDTLKDYLAGIDERLIKLKEEKDKGDMENYAIDVHGLKSDSRYLGFMKLGDIAYNHEMKSKEKDLDYVKNNFKELEDELNKVLKIVREYAENI